MDLITLLELILVVVATAATTGKSGEVGLTECEETLAALLKVEGCGDKIEVRWIEREMKRKEEDKLRIQKEVKELREELRREREGRMKEDEKRRNERKLQIVEGKDVEEKLQKELKEVREELRREKQGRMKEDEKRRNERKLEVEERRERKEETEKLKKLLRNYTEEFWSFKFEKTKQLFLSKLLNNSYQGDRDVTEMSRCMVEAGNYSLLKSLMKEVVDEACRRMEAGEVLQNLQGTQSEHAVASYLALLEHLNTSSEEVLQLALGMKTFNLTGEPLQDWILLRNKLPSSVRAIVFAKTVRIVSVRYTEGLSVVRDHLVTSKGGDLWELSPSGRGFHIRHVLGGYLGASWRLALLSDTSENLFEPHGEDVYLKHAGWGQYVCPSTGHFHQGSRRVYTWAQRGRDTHCLWRIEMVT